MPVTFADAEKLIRAAHARAAETGIKVSVAVVDEGGNLVALGRMDGAPPISPSIAEGKALAAAMFVRDGAALLTTATDRPAFWNAISGMPRVSIVPGLGSVLVKRRDVVVGALGVSGGKPEQDLECAETALGALASSGLGQK